MRSVPIYVFQKDDAKYRAWAAALADVGIETTAVRGSPLKAPLHVLSLLVRGRRVRGYVFRYLNDYPSLARTLLRLLSELAVVVMVRIVGGSIFWIAHNVDQESCCYYKKLSEFRRRTVSSVARCVFVTDPLLERAARQRMRGVRNLGWMCFGRPAQLPPNEATRRLREEARGLRKKLEQNHPGKKVYIGLCVSAASPKCRHFLTICQFLDAREREGTIVGMVVVGALSEIDDERFRQAQADMLAHERISLIAEAIPVREPYLADQIDFFYRALDDLSVSYSLYVAAAVRKPMITEDGTFLGEMVATYGLGAVARGAQRMGPGWLEAQLAEWSPHAADSFLESRSWKVAAERFKHAVSCATHRELS